MQFLLFKEEKFYALCTLKDKNFAPKQNERDCPMTKNSGKPYKKGLPVFFVYKTSTLFEIFSCVFVYCGKSLHML